jgi:hypothetical protein
VGQKFNSAWRELRVAADSCAPLRFLPTESLVSWSILTSRPISSAPNSPSADVTCEGKGASWKDSAFKQVVPLDQRLAQHAQQLRKETKGLPPGGEREKLIRKARQLETASDVSHRLDKGHPS